MLPPGAYPGTAYPAPIPRPQVIAQTPPPRPQNAPKPIVARGQSSDDRSPPTQAQASNITRHTSVTIPSPAQLGIESSPTPETVDWASAKNRLERLGAISLNLDRERSGEVRFTCLFATAMANKKHRVEAVAATEAEAVRLVLERSEQWAGAH